MSDKNRPQDLDRPETPPERTKRVLAEMRAKEGGPFTEAELLKRPIVWRVNRPTQKK